MNAAFAVSFSVSMDVRWRYGTYSSSQRIKLGDLVSASANAGDSFAVYKYIAFGIIRKHLLYALSIDYYREIGALEHPSRGAAV